MKKEVACLMIINWKNQLLLQDRKWISKYWEEWSFFGWWIEEWETHLQAAKREAKEELNIDLNNENIKYLWVVDNQIESIWKEYTRYVYLIRTDKKESDFIDLEWSWAKFFDINKISELKFNTKIKDEINLLKININN